MLSQAQMVRNTAKVLSGLSGFFPGGEFPANWLVYDCETSGFSPEKDVIVEWGHVLVRNGEVVDRNSVVINWFLQNVVPHDYILRKLRYVAQAMLVEARPWRITEEVMREEGVAPSVVLPWIYDLLATAKAHGLMFVSHGGFHFDNRMLKAHFEKDLQQEFIFDETKVIDTGAIVKASQIAEDDPRVLPKYGELLLDYCKRVHYMKTTSVYWNLKHCMQLYGLDTGIDMNALHTAGEDAYATHLLMTEFSRIMKTNPTAAPAQQTLFPPKPASVVRVVPAAELSTNNLTAQHYIPIKRRTRNR